MRRIELAENDRTGAAVTMSSDEAAALEATGLVEVRPTGHTTWQILPVTNLIGAVRTGSWDVVVHPKAKFSSLLFMLGFARDPGLLPQEFDGAVEAELWPLVGETLARLATAAMLRGALQGYVTTDEALTVVRGRIRVGDQMARRPGMLLPLEVRYDDYAVDITENQILRTALRRLALVPRMPEGLRRRLAHLAARLDGAQVLLSGAPIPSWQPSRLNARYQPALRLAEIVLATTGLGTSRAGQPVASFVVNMATVFEDFLSVALTEAFAKISPGYTEAQHRSHLDEADVVSIRPDVVHVVHRKPRAVLDAKYKLAEGHTGFPVADLYQMHAYCTVLGLRQGYLIYAAAGSDRTSPGAHRVRNTAITVTTWPVVVSGSPASLLSQVDAIARAALGTDERKG